jgi:hypothetical protein
VGKVTALELGAAESYVVAADLSVRAITPLYFVATK